MTSINLNRLAAEVGTPVVYDPVPEREREQYRFWRGLSLARLALELTRGNRTLGLDGNFVHFADFHLYAANTAKNIAEGGCRTQVQGKEQNISDMLGRPFTHETQHPALVVAHGSGSPYTRPSDMGMQQGYKMAGMLSDLDPMSQGFIEDYFEVKLPR